MSQVFDEEGNVVPVTMIKAGPCYVARAKKEERDGYEAFQIGFEKTKKEFRKKANLKEGDKIDVSAFEKGDKVKVSGNSKGKGFAGVVKRWNFSMKPATHGTKHEARAMGAVGGAFPQRVIKGRKMPGRLGGGRVSVKNLEVQSIDSENGIILLKGAVPGAPGSLLEIIKL